MTETRPAKQAQLKVPLLTVQCRLTSENQLKIMSHATNTAYRDSGHEGSDEVHRNSESSSIQFAATLTLYDMMKG